MNLKKRQYLKSNFLFSICFLFLNFVFYRISVLPVGLDRILGAPSLDAPERVDLTELVFGGLSEEKNVIF